ncbi:MAG: cation:proton antiporter [Candidatus Cloacimonetes bacterium]|nr:cation:proton antiporter [Candidatus Cloacimonadota bacterium]
MADLIYNIAAIIALIGMMLSFVRLIIGHTIADRAVALDGMTIISISLIVFIAYYSNRIIYLDVAIVYGLISFVGIVAIARYLERGI